MICLLQCYSTNQLHSCHLETRPDYYDTQTRTKMEKVSSITPINLLPVPFKVLEKVTIKQVNKLVNLMNKNLKAEKYCWAVIHNVSQLVEKAWQTGLISQTKKLLPCSHFQLLKWYLTDRQFLVKSI